MKLVVITQRVDPGDPALGATVPMLRALAERVDELVVLTLAERDAGLPANVRVKVIAGRNQALRGARLLAALAPELRGEVAVLAHMSPIYAVLAAPLTRSRRIPLLLWFTHWKASRLLRLAERVSTRVLSVDTVSFPLASRKVVAIGHGIDVQAIACVEHVDGPLRLLALGRTSPAKGLDTIVAAAGRVDGVELELRGPSLTDEERAYRARLPHVEAAVPRTEIAAVYARSGALVNNMRSGALDKVVFEAAAACLPVLVSNPGFARLVDGIEPALVFPQDDAAALADRIRALRDAGAEARQRIGRELRSRVERDHSVEHWAERVLEASR